MACKCKEVLAKLAELEATIQEMVLTNSTIVGRIANNIELKLDILSNSEQIASQQKASIKKAKTKSVFFKDLVKEGYEAHLNELYTQARIDELLQIEDISSKKTQSAKLGKLADYLYKDFKNNKLFSDKLDDLYLNYKASLEAEEEETKED